MRPKGSPEALESRRQQAIALLNQDHQPVEVARIVGVDRRSVRRWKAAYLKEGKYAIKAKPKGRPRKLTEKTRKILERKLNAFLVFVMDSLSVGTKNDNAPYPSIEGTRSGLRPARASHVKR